MNAFSGRIVFDHLPKTAGQAVNAWLRDWLGIGCVTDNLVGRHRELIRRMGGDYSIISGHMGFIAGESLDPRYRYVTLIREPVDRAISWIYYVLHDTDLDANHPFRRGAQEFIRSNGMEANSEFLQSFSNLYVNHFARVAIGDSGASTDDPVSHAIKVLETYDLVGDYQYIEQFIEDFAQMIGGGNPPALRVKNKTTTRPGVEEISPALRARIEALNELDTAFYREVKKRDRKAPPSSTQTVDWERYEGSLSRRPNFFAPEFRLLAFEFRSPPGPIRPGTVLQLLLDFCLNGDVEEGVVGIHIHNVPEGTLMFGINSELMGIRFTDLRQGSYQMQFSVVANLPPGEYTAGMAMNAVTGGTPREIFWSDSIVPFTVSPPDPRVSVGVVDLPAATQLTRTDWVLPGREILDGAGTLNLIAPPTDLVVGSRSNVRVLVANWTQKTWMGDRARPVSISYHWLDSTGSMIDFEGLRSPLAEVPANGTVSGTLELQAPSLPGTYILLATVVQDGVRWLEDVGFLPARHTVSVGVRKVNVEDQA